MVEPLVVSPSGVDAVALGDNAAFEHNGALVQYEGIGAGEVGRSLAFVRDPRFVGTGFFAGEAPDGLTTVYGDPIPADVFVYWRDPDDPMAQEVLVGATKSAPDGTWRITGLNYNLRYVVRARASGRDDVTVVGVQPSRSDVIAYVDHLEPTEEFDGLTGYVLLDSGLPPFTCQVIEPLPYGLSARIDGRKLLIEGVSSDNGLWGSVVRVTASNGVWVDVPVVVKIAVVLVDKHWDKVISLLHFDGDLTDETGRVWINSGVTTDNTNSLYNDYGVFSGSSNMTATIPALGGNDFTIEAWVNRDANTDYRCIFDSRALPNLTSGLAIYTSSILPDNVPVIWGANQILKGSSKITASEWVHIAVVRESGILYYYVNGSLIGFCSFTSDLTNTTATIGSTYKNSQFYRGHIDELRITKGVARYTADFTPPTAPFLSR